MKRALLTLACLTGACTALYGQQPATDPAEGPARDFYVSAPPVVSDMELFHIPLEGSYDVFSQLADYNFSAVRYRRRGYDFSGMKSYVGGLDATSAVSGRTDYALLRALRYVQAGRARTSGAGMAAGAVGSLCGMEEYSTHPSDAPDGVRVSLFASDRTARAGLRAYAAARSANGKWYGNALYSLRAGRDAHIDGQFLDEQLVAAGIERRLARDGSLALFALFSPSQRSQRAAATREAFGLIGDKLYNPAWGWCEGRQRALRARDDRTATAILSLRTPLGQRTELRAALSYTAAMQGYSGLTWYDAQSPLPDYHRNLPSWNGSEQLAQLWQQRDPRVTQIDWQELIDQSRLAGGPAVYVVDSDVERIGSVQAMAGLSFRPQRRLRWDYGVRLRIERHRYHDRADDLLGAGWLTDVDQYLIDDEYYGDRVLNDVHNPGRKVGEGEEFGYNYLMRNTSTTVYGTLTYGDRRLRLGAGAEGGNAAMRREGFYEKQMFAGGASLGASRMLHFMEYTLKLSAGYSFSPRQFVDAVLLLGQAAPRAADLFLSPRYCNLVCGDPQAASTVGAEADYRLILPAVKVKLTGYWTLTRRDTEIFHYYDDISATYGNLVMSDVARKYYGVELGAAMVFSHRLSLSLAMAAGTARYASNPRMDLYADVDGTPVYVGARAPLKEYRLGGSPQGVASAELRYSGVRGWLASITLSGMTGHYIAIDPTRRMPRTTGYAPSPEAFDAMVAQERFPGAATLGLFLSKTFRMGRHNLVALASVNNALDKRDIVYSGYEQMRLRPAGTGLDTTYTPYDAKYLYGYGRTWYCSVIYRF